MSERSSSCVVTAEGNYPAQSFQVGVTWQPLQLGVVPDADAVSPSAVDGYSVRVRNPNPTTVAIATLDLTLPGGFSYQPGTTSGALTVDPTPTGPGALTLRWSGGFSVPALGDAVVRLKVRAASADRRSLRLLACVSGRQRVHDPADRADRPHHRRGGRSLRRVLHDRRHRGPGRPAGDARRRRHLRLRWRRQAVRRRRSRPAVGWPRRRPPRRRRGCRRGPRWGRGRRPRRRLGR